MQAERIVVYFPKHGIGKTNRRHGFYIFYSLMLSDALAKKATK